MYLFNLLKAANRLRRQTQLQKEFNKTYLQSLLARLQADHNGSFSPKLLKKINYYYCTLVPTVLCSSYCNLMGKEFTDSERERATIISLMTPVYDDFFDDGTLTAKQIEQITTDPYTYPAQSFEEKVFKELHIWMLKNVPYPDTYVATFAKVYEAQLISLQQTNPAITDEELYSISYNKCYYAFLIYHNILDAQPTEAFKEMLYPFSGLLQLSNDAFDVYKDLQDGIYTLPNLHRNLPALIQKYKEDNHRFNTLLMTMPYPKVQKEDFLITINLIISRGWIALQFLNKLLQSLPKDVDLKIIERKRLICDMETPTNIVKWLVYSYQFTKR